MMKTATRSRLPALVIRHEDHARLMDLAVAALERMPNVAEELLNELERAKVVRPEKIPATSVQMGSTVTYKADAASRTVTLVWPEDADIAAGRVSVMTPVGAALIGLSEGQSIRWTARDGRVHEMTIEHVHPPGAEKPAA